MGSDVVLRQPQRRFREIPVCYDSFTTQYSTAPTPAGLTRTAVSGQGSLLPSPWGHSHPHTHCGHRELTYSRCCCGVEGVKR
jgi:hypothetical protein